MREEAAVFLLKGGCIVGAGAAVDAGCAGGVEQTSVGSSLFAQPLMLQAVPLEADGLVDAPEARMERVLAALDTRVRAADGDLAEKSDHLSLLRRWYYRPEKQRAGEIFFPKCGWKLAYWVRRNSTRGVTGKVIGEPGVMAETVS